MVQHQAQPREMHFKGHIGNFAQFHQIRAQHRCQPRQYLSDHEDGANQQPKRHVGYHNDHGDPKLLHLPTPRAGMPLYKA